MLVVVAAGLAAASMRGPVVATSDTAATIHVMRERKEELAREAIGGKVMLFAGSGALYSIRALTLATELRVPVINMGINAGLGLDHMLYRARRELQPNDVAVLVIEYELYADEKANWTLADYTIPFDLPYLLHAGPRRSLEIAGLITAEEYLGKVYGGWFGKPYAESHVLSAMDAAGDLVANRKGDQTTSQRKKMADETVIREWHLNPVQARMIDEFIAWCHARGITVVAAFPALRRASFGPEAIETITATLPPFYRDRGVPVVGLPGDFLFDDDQFIDSRYHMNDEGAAIMTGRIAGPLRLALQCELRWNLPEASPDECRAMRHWVAIDIARDEVPSSVRSMQGFFQREAWGRWTAAPRARIVTTTPFTGPFRLRIRVANVFTPGVAQEARVRIGAETRVFPARKGDVTLDFEGREPSSTIDIETAVQGSPKALGQSDDERPLGLGIARIDIQPVTGR